MISFQGDSIICFPVRLYGMFSSTKLRGKGGAGKGWEDYKAGNLWRFFSRSLTASTFLIGPC